MLRKASDREFGPQQTSELKRRIPAKTALSADAAASSRQERHLYSPIYCVPV